MWLLHVVVREWFLGVIAWYGWWEWLLVVVAGCVCCRVVAGSNSWGLVAGSGYCLWLLGVFAGSYGWCGCLERLLGVGAGWGCGV